MNRIHTYLLTKARLNRRQQTRKNRIASLRTSGWGLAAMLATGMVVLILMLTWQLSRLTFDLPSIEQIPQQLNAQSAIFNKPTRFVDRSGTQALLDISMPDIQRKYMRVSGVGERVSQDFVSALISVTEPGYQTSNGVDLLKSEPGRASDDCAKTCL